MVSLTHLIVATGDVRMLRLTCKFLYEDSMNTPGGVYTNQSCLHREDSADTKCLLKWVARAPSEENRKLWDTLVRSGPLGVSARGAHTVPRPQRVRIIE